MCVFSALDTNLPWGRRVCRPLRDPSLLLSLAHSFPFPAVFHLDLVGWNRTLIGHVMPEWLCVSDRVYALSATIQATILKQYGRGSANKTSLSTGRSNMQDQLFGHLSSPDPLLFKFWSVVLQMEIYTSLNKIKNMLLCAIRSSVRTNAAKCLFYFDKLKFGSEARDGFDTDGVEMDCKVACSHYTATAGRQNWLKTDTKWFHLATISTES